MAITASPVGCSQGMEPATTGALFRHPRCNAAAPATIAPRVNIPPKSPPAAPPADAPDAGGGGDGGGNGGGARWVLVLPTTINGKYRVGTKIGSGSFGCLYEGWDPDGRSVAIKLEPANTKHPQLLYEARVIKALQGGHGIPVCYWYGLEGEWHAMVMNRLGHSLEDLFNLCRRSFSVSTVLRLGIQMLERLDYIHKRHCIHRDVKPDNFLVGRYNDSNTIYLIDFGLAKKYRDGQGRHIGYKEGKNLTGTARYASLATHLGIEQARRDDVEGLGYVLLYFLRGSLPWQGLKATSKRDKYSKITQTKMTVDIGALCSGLPECFKTYMTYCRALEFGDAPNLKYLMRLFDESLRSETMKPFDWVPLLSSCCCNSCKPEADTQQQYQQEHQQQQSPQKRMQQQRQKSGWPPVAVSSPNQQHQVHQQPILRHQPYHQNQKQQWRPLRPQRGRFTRQNT